MFVSFHGWLDGTRLVTTDLYRFCENWAFCLTDRGESWGQGLRRGKGGNTVTEHNPPPPPLPTKLALCTFSNALARCHVGKPRAVHYKAEISELELFGLKRIFVFIFIEFNSGNEGSKDTGNGQNVRL